MAENIKLAFRSIWGNKLRSALTMLGIVIGIASIIAIVSTIKGTNELIKQSLIGSGSNSVIIELYRGDERYDSFHNRQAEIPVIAESAISEISRLPEIVNASLYTRRNAYDNVYFGKTSLLGGWIYGIDGSYFEIYGYRIKTGRSFTSDDYAQARKVAVLDMTAASSLIPGEDPVGKIIEVLGEPFTVIGIVESSYKSQPNINTVEDYYAYVDQSGGCVFLTESAWPILYGYDEPYSVAVSARSTDDMTSAGKKAADIINGSLSLTETGGLYYKSEDLLSRVRELQELASASRNQLLWIAGISLFVGGVGVMNIMLVSVTERATEIGLKKALGARKRLIMLQFLTEAGVLTGLGGVIGVVSGTALSGVISRVSGTPSSISLPSIVVAVVFSAVIGVLFGMIPAVKAANLNPIDVLRRQ